MPKRRFPFLHWCAKLIAGAFRAVPCDRRYAVALAVSRLVRPLLVRSGAYRERRRHGVESAAEIALELVLSALDRYALRYSPRMHVVGWDAVEETLAAGRGALIIATHAMLNSLLLRHADDRGITLGPVAVVETPIPGASRMAEGIYQQASFLMNLRSRLRDGRAVAGMIDRDAASDARTKTVEIATGEIHLADALPRIALGVGAGIFFLSSRLDRSGVVRISVAPATATESAESVILEFADFIREQTDRLARELR
jgi:hypothetical protein